MILIQNGPHHAHRRAGAAQRLPAGGGWPHHRRCPPHRRPGGLHRHRRRRPSADPGCVEAHCHIGLDNECLRWEGMDYNEIVDP